MGTILKLLGMTPGWSIASIGARIMTALLAVGGTYWGVTAAYDSWKTNLCAAKVSDVTTGIKDQTIATLQAKLTDQSNQIKNLEARRSDDELAVKMASDQAKVVIGQLHELQSKSPPAYLSDAEVDILNGKLLKKGSKP